MPIKSQTTEGITVSVDPKFDGDITDAQDVKFIFTYTITVHNSLSHAVKLLSRKWDIFDSIGKHHMVEGEGVVGMQPEIAPGASFSYSSWCPLDSNLGTMQGSYLMENTVTGGTFEISIPRFELSADWVRN
ncbi:MAG: Co2+/Mg2+ efflux protein ApaG [Saprospiraceae bacterium]|nr:Co2+/Mg2+ efflux protein ApaG [Saprospiraceae bacterium]MBK8849592.1 Co2+/Mg2+ efflux protein ApaG [Saprospiraceae bacterium]